MLKLSKIRKLKLSFKKLDIKAHLKLDANKSLKREIYRKLIHLSSLWIPAFIYFTDKSISIAVFALLFAINTIVEYGNHKKWPWVRKSFSKLFSQTLRSKETKKTTFQASGSMYVLLAALICTIIFSKPVAIIALTVMLISDTCAALIGKTYGSRKIYKNKSIEGTAAFFLSALLIMILYNPLYPLTYAGVVACITATIAEVLEDKIEIDDNLSIPLFVGIVLSLL